jgi:hypothetical protein
LPYPTFGGGGRRGKLRKLERSVGSGEGKCHVTQSLFCLEIFENIFATK